MLLPTAPCPRCRRDVLVHRTLGIDEQLELRCVDCDTRLDRFGMTPDLEHTPLEDVTASGYADLDKPRPLGPGGCFQTRGCDGCPKIDTRPW